MSGYERGVASTVCVFCFDETTSKGKAGEAANITLYQLEDGASPPPTQVADTTFVEVSATLALGYYIADLAGTEIDTKFTYFFPMCSTAGIGAIFYRPAFTVSPNFSLLAITATTGLVSANMAQTLPTTPTADTTGDALKRASVGIPQSAAGAIGGLALVDNLFGPVISGSVSDATPLAGNFDCGGDVSAVTGTHDKQYCWFTSGPLKGNFRSITTHTGGAPPNLAFTGTGNNDVPFDAAPNNGDTFIITGYDGSLP